jgi:hypothetical protein
VCAKRSLTVKEVLADTRWTVHFRRDMAAHTIVQFNVLWEAVQPVMLENGVRDSLTWKWTNNGTFSVQSAYNIEFDGSIATNRKWQFFLWLAALGRCLTADNHAKRGRYVTHLLLRQALKEKRRTDTRQRIREAHLRTKEGPPGWDPCQTTREATIASA